MTLCAGLTITSGPAVLQGLYTADGEANGKPKYRNVAKGGIVRFQRSPTPQWELVFHEAKYKGGEPDSWEYASQVRGGGGG